MRKLKKILGAGLLEMMLSFAIIVVILVMATRYYSVAHKAQKAQASTSQEAPASN